MTKIAHRIMSLLFLVGVATPLPYWWRRDRREARKQLAETSNSKI
jgi:hypothetical protein